MGVRRKRYMGIVWSWMVLGVGFIYGLGTLEVEVQGLWFRVLGAGFGA